MNLGEKARDSGARSGSTSSGSNACRASAWCSTTARRRAATARRRAVERAACKPGLGGSREAKRLAREHPGHFFVLEAVAEFRRVDVERVDLRPAALSPLLYPRGGILSAREGGRAEPGGEVAGA